MSVSQLTKDNNCLITFDTNGFVKNHQGQVLMMGTKRNGLYALDQSRNNNLALTTATTVAKVPITTWHKRLGHLNESAIKFFSNNRMIHVTSSKKETSICSTCQMSKSCRLPFISSNKINTSPFEKVHCDLWGPAPILSCQGFKYYASLVDDYSRYTWIFPLK